MHLAKVNGQQVVVKVQRPGLKDLFDIDLKNIRALAVWLQKVSGTLLPIEGSHAPEAAARVRCMPL